MMYPRGRRIKDEKNVDVVKHAARVGAELGADIIKCPYTGSIKTFRDVVQGCPVPVVIAGGSKMNDEQTLKMIEGSLKAGAAGISMGRNAFQHEDPTSFIRAATAMVHQSISVAEALKMIRNSNKQKQSSKK